MIPIHIPISILACITLNTISISIYIVIAKILIILVGIQFHTLVNKLHDSKYFIHILYLGYNRTYLIFLLFCQNILITIVLMDFFLIVFVQFLK